MFIMIRRFFDILRRSLFLTIEAVDINLDETVFFMAETVNLANKKLKTTEDLMKRNIKNTPKTHKLNK